MDQATPPPGQGEKAEQHSQGAGSQGAGEGLQNGHSALPVVAQGAGRMNVGDRLKQRRERISYARMLLKKYGTAQQLATVDLDGMDDNARETFIAEMERQHS